MSQIKIASPSTEDFDSSIQFMRILEALTDNRAYCCSSVEDWKNWDPNDDDYKILKKIEDSLIGEYGEFEDEDEVDQRIVLWEYVKHFFNYNPSSLARVITCASVAMDNAFDPDKNTIEWRENIEKALDFYEETHKDEKN